MKQAFLIVLVSILLLAACGSSPEQQAALTPTPTNTPSSIVDLDGILFFDYNGSGLREEGEPPIANFGICAALEQGQPCVTSNENGGFVFSKLAPYGRTVSLTFIDPNAGNPSLAFRYINIWKGTVTIPAHGATQKQVLNDTEIWSLENGFQATAGQQNEIGLMQGFLSLPMRCYSRAQLGSYVDLNHNLGAFRNYAGETQLCVDFSFLAYTTEACDNHQGIEWITTSEGHPVLAAAPGIVIDVLEDRIHWDWRVRVLHDVHGEKYTTDYAHNYVNLVEIGDRVFRGQTIARVGHYYMEIPSLHFSMFKVSVSTNDNGWIVDNIYNNADYPKVSYNDGTMVPAVLDPFRDIADPDSLSYWTMDNNPICLP